MLRNILIGVGILVVVGALSLGGLLFWVMRDLPDHKQLLEYQPPVTTRVHAGDGSLIKEFASEQRIFVPYDAIPEKLKNAFISAEDKNFREHTGVDWWGVLRASVANVRNIAEGERLEGGSTITQQVAKNMLLSNERTITRKVREAILAQRIHRALGPDRVLELYLNQIFLGNGAYGVAAAALNYFNKPLSELTLSESAYLAALPKMPSRLNLVRDRERVEGRIAYVLDRMVENGFITEAEAKAAKADYPVQQDRLSGDTYVSAAYFVEEVRKKAIELCEAEAELCGRGGGEEAFFQGGLSVRTSLDTELQLAAVRSLRTGLEAFDRRRGWRGALGTATEETFAQTVREAELSPPGASPWRLALVTSVQGNTVGVRIGATGAVRTLRREDVSWANANRRNPLTVGNIVFVEPVGTEGAALRQVPEVQGALVAMDPHTGRVVAMVGGYSLVQAGFNRAVQAQRQPGSTFKAIVYAAALESGRYTPASQILDAPFAANDGAGRLYIPENYSGEYYGLSTLRFGLEQSKNVMTVRLVEEMGMRPVATLARRMGVYDDVPEMLSVALGASETTLLRMTTAYAELVNGGRDVSPTFIDRIQNRQGETVWRADARDCVGCNGEWSRQAPPQLPDTREQVLDPITAFQITSMLQGAVQRGTAQALRSLERPVAGKTGTTNDERDAWFVGFTPDLVVGVWVGYDTPRSLGRGESGGRTAVPIFGDFMRTALSGRPPTPFRTPEGTRFVQVDLKTGGLPGLETTATINEAFRPGTEPVREVTDSPFSFGGALEGEGVPVAPGAPVDPNAPPMPANAPPAVPPAAKKDEELGGLY
jgi:penicillin-binding protein 1A